MKRIELHIPKELIDKLEANRDGIEAALKQYAETESHKLMDKLQRDYCRVLFETAYRRYKPHRSVRIVSSEPPYMGGGIITTLNAGKRHKR